jgi:hypothetical protein
MAVGVVRRRPLAACIALTSLLALPSGARAQAPDIHIDDGVMAGDPERPVNPRFELWPELEWRGSKTITYNNSAGKYRNQVKKAAAAWNNSGANVNWKPVSRSQAKVKIKITSSLPTQGLATTNGTSAVIEVQEDLLTQFPPKQNSEAITVAILAHEMGHVMGLGHEPRKCATMNANLWSGCSFADEPWEYRCRPLEPDDVRGGVKAFGGRPKDLRKPFCSLGKAPNAVTDFLATYDSDQSQVVLTWGLPGRKPPNDLTI